MLPFQRDTSSWSNNLDGKPNDDDHPNSGTLQMSTANLGSQTMSHNIDFYRFEWFHLLIAQIMFCFVAFSTVLLSVQNIMSALYLIFVPGGVLGASFIPIVSNWAFSLVFLLLQHYKQPARTFFEKYLHVPNQWHRTIHRTFLWTWFFIYIGMLPLQFGISPTLHVDVFKLMQLSPRVISSLNYRRKLNSKLGIKKIIAKRPTNFRFFNDTSSVLPNTFSRETLDRRRLLGNEADRAVLQVCVWL